eukprot:s792_g20.t1
MSLLWLWSWLCLCMCALAEESCSASPRPVSGNCLLQKKGVVKKVAPAHEVLELKKLDDDDDDGGDDDGDEEDEPLFDNRPGRSGNGKPLHKCQGSCSDDADCEGDLVCVTPKFVGWDGFVPGCRSGPQGKPLWEFRYCSGKPPDGWRTATTSTTTPEPTPPPPPAPSVITDCPAGGVCARLMAFNVYYAALGREDRMDGIAQAIADMTPDIAVITEQWKEKPTILEKIKQKTNKYYAFCLGGPQEKWWDGDILYRADLFEVVKDSIMDWGANRFAEPKHHKPDPGLTPRKHKDSGKKVIIYGAHPVCCGNEPIHLQNALDFAEHAKTLVPRQSIHCLGFRLQSQQCCFLAQKSSRIAIQNLKPFSERLELQKLGPDLHTNHQDHMDNQEAMVVVFVFIFIIIVIIVTIIIVTTIMFLFFVFSSSSSPPSS